MADELRVLLLEDDPDDAALITEALQRLGPRTTVAETRAVTSVEEALAAHAESPSDVALVDLNVRDSNGVQTVATLHAKCPDLAIVVMTGLPTKDLALDALASGAQEYLLKGEVDPEILGRAIRFAYTRQALLLERAKQVEAAERELQRFQGKSLQSGAPVAARMLGVRTLEEADPDRFALMVQEFAAILDKSLEEQRLEVDHNIPNKLKQFGRVLGSHGASHLDVVSLLRHAVNDRQGDGGDVKAYAYMQEARHRGFQLMGYLASYYRDQSLGHRHLPREEST